jgi:hypothetical protein
MIKVRIHDIESGLMFDTEMPQIPRKNDKIGAWFDDEWCLCDVKFFIYEFEKTGDFLRVEINVIAK